ncbi:MAG TPA: serine/threonine-protein kinase [Polyangiaceae bacterium]|jgi:serine/threonine-protein kinase|nr:serine/threonine-protein kinase [Polyangiaceae bacterium]
MKACPICARLYPDDAGFCPVDGSQLNSATQVPVLADSQDPRIGQLLANRYQVRRVVADGGMGRVYEALDMQVRRNVALKVLHPDVSRDEIAVQRFKREFEVSKMLPHDYIVEVLDFQPTTDASFVLVMEFLYGEELRALLKRESVIPPGRVIRMLSQAALGLDEAHARKFVHRDLKPDNLFLCQTSDGDITKVLDFGSAKDKGESAKKLTVLGTTIGSPFYMAPEQAQGLDTLDHRADVWALAAIVYECVCGRVPFIGNNGPSILLEILTKEPQAPSEVGKGQKYPVPPTLDRVMAHAFKKSAALRIASVGALADAIGAAYGLTGNHKNWAATPEADLNGRVTAAMPNLMTAVQAPRGGNAADSFFGETDSLDTMGDPFSGGGAQAMPAPAGFAAPQAQAYPADPMTSIAGVPKSSNNALLMLLVGGGALVVGVVLVVVFMLLR